MAALRVRTRLERALLLAAVACSPAGLPAAEPAVDRALAYLARETAAWPRENGCFSCHNNGDGARALLVAQRRGRAAPREALTETLDWLRSPAKWELAPGEPGFSDKRLARLQYSAALAEAVRAGAVESRRPLLDAATMLAADQLPSGAWEIEQEASVGSPTTWGAPLATATAREVLLLADAGRFREQIDLAGEWLREVPLDATVHAAAVAMAFASGSRSQDSRMESRRQEAVEKLLAAQGGSGGWGPYAAAPPEAFDTAVALIALCRSRDVHSVRAAIERGRALLASTQLAPGGWIETTRPSGARSYAQHVSTSAWATQALIECR